MKLTIAADNCKAAEYQSLSGIDKALTDWFKNLAK